MKTTNHIKCQCIISLKVPPQLKKIHSHFIVYVSSYVIFRIGFWYLPLFSHVIVTNVGILPELESELLITMLNPNLAAFVQIHWIIWLRIEKSYLVVNYFLKSKWTTPSQHPLTQKLWGQC